MIGLAKMKMTPPSTIRKNHKDLEKILESHKLWLEYSGQKGRRADFSRANLHVADLSGANLSKTNLYCAYLSGANLFNANLSFANLLGANLSEADLSGVDLTRASLSFANLRGADLRVATAKGCWIKGVRFSSPKDRARLLMLGAWE